MLRIFILLFPLILLSETAMKCEAGKCGGGKCGAADTNSAKKVPTKPIELENTMIANNAPSKPHREIKPTVEQLFNVRTTQVKTIITAKKQVNYGYIVAEESRKIDIHAWFSGYITKLFADKLYQKVKKGDPLAEVYSPEVYKAKQDYLHSLEYDTRRASPQMLKSAETKLRLLGVSDIEIKQIKDSRKVREFTTLYSPQSGWIFEKNINQGSSFTMQKKLFQIVNLDKVWIEVKLYQDEIEKLSHMNHFMIEPKGTAKTYTASTPLLYPTLNPKEATATLRLVLDNNESQLMPGMYAKVYASANPHTRLVIPQSAVIRKNGIWYAFLATEFKGEYEPIAIEIKPLDKDYYEVIKGLQDGDRVVNNALFMMDSDAQINGVY